jgi:hypothetical protein
MNVEIQVSGMSVVRVRLVTEHALEINDPSLLFALLWVDIGSGGGSSASFGRGTTSCGDVYVRFGILCEFDQGEEMSSQVKRHTYVIGGMVFVSFVFQVIEIAIGILHDIVFQGLASKIINGTRNNLDRSSWISTNRISMSVLTFSLRSSPIW